MAELAHLLRLLAAQYGDQVFGAEALAGAQRRRQCLLCDRRPVDRLDGREAAVAVAAPLAGLAEIAEQGLAPAAGGLAQAEQRVQPLMLDPFRLLRPLRIVDHQAADPDIVHAVEHQGFRRQPVPPGAADFLVIGFDGRRDVGVGDEADVRLVDAHAEGDGRNHDHAVLRQEAILMPVANRLIHAGVVGHRRAPVRRQTRR